VSLAYTRKARGLNLAGLPIQVVGTLRADALMTQVRDVVEAGDLESVTQLAENGSD